MQIHELTQHPLNEGFMDTLKSAGKNALGTVGPAIKNAASSVRSAVKDPMAWNQRMHAKMPAALQQ